MAEPTTVGQLMVSEALPEDLRRPNYLLDKKGTEKLLMEVAAKYPDRYKEVIQKLMNLGAYSAEASGHSISLSSTLKPKHIHDLIEKIRAQVQAIGDSDQPAAKKEAQILELMGKHNKGITDEIMADGLRNGNPLAIQALSGSRGNSSQLRQLVAGDGLVADHRDRVIPVPILSGYAEGLDPVEYFAGSYGARKGSISTKFCLRIGTKVLMADFTEKKIEQIKPGEWVLGSDYRGKLVPTRVINTYCNGMREVKKYTFKKQGIGFCANIEATSDHRILCRYMCYSEELQREEFRWGELPLSYVEANIDTVSPVISAGVEYDGGEYEPLAFLAGVLVGCGTISMGPFAAELPSVHITEESLYDFLTNHCEAFNIVLKQHSKSKHQFTLRENTRLPKRFRNFNKWLRDEGLCNQIQSGRSLPNNIFQWNNLSVYNFLSGMLSSMGHFNVANKSLEIGTSSKTLAQQLVVLLRLYCGVWCSNIHENNDTPFNGEPRPYYRISVSHPLAISRLHSLVKIKSPLKQARFDKIMSELVCKAYNYNFTLDMVEEQGRQLTFDIEVDNPSHLFALSNGFIVSNSTQEAGFFGKQLAQSAHRLVITEDDCGTGNGIPVKAGDPDNVGSVLLQDTGNYKAGTIITPKVLKELPPDDMIYVRSPITCQAPEGLCAKCAGAREKGTLPDIGDNVGMPSAQALGEKMAQGMLCLHGNTMVRMADGTDKPIRNIEVGEIVIGSDLAGNTRPVKVLNKFESRKHITCWEVTLNTTNHLDPKNEVRVICSLDHKFLVKRVIEGGVTVNEKKSLISLFDEESLTYQWFVCADGVDRHLVKLEYFGPLDTYDIEVDHPNHLFVLSNNIILSNSAKHSGGMAGGPSLHGGFDYLNQLIQVPTNFAGAATIAKADGRVAGIEEAPQGGHYITVDKEKYYVPNDQMPSIKVGDEVEAGDIMSNGIGNPAEITEHKGVGHGRLYFMKTLYDGFKNSGITPHRRNVEVLARSLVNHVQITDPDGYGGFLPDDVVQYDELRRNWEPREGAHDSEPKRAINKYLEKDTLQYSIGTRVTPKIAQDLHKNKVTKVHVHDQAPPFKPVMVRAMESAMYDPNWQTRLYGSFLGKGFREAVHRGRGSSIHDTSFVPSMAEGVDFGKKLKTTGKY